MVFTKREIIVGIIFAILHISAIYMQSWFYEYKLFTNQVSHYTNCKVRNQFNDSWVQANTSDILTDNLITVKTDQGYLLIGHGDKEGHISTGFINVKCNEDLEDFMPYIGPRYKEYIIISCYNIYKPDKYVGKYYTFIKDKNSNTNGITMTYYDKKNNMLNVYAMNEITSIVYSSCNEYKKFINELIDYII